MHSFHASMLTAGKHNCIYVLHLAYMSIYEGFVAQKNKTKLNQNKGVSLACSLNHLPLKKDIEISCVTVE